MSLFRIQTPGSIAAGISAFAILVGAGTWRATHADPVEVEVLGETTERGTASDADTSDATTAETADLSEQDSDHTPDTGPQNADTTTTLANTPPPEPSTIAVQPSERLQLTVTLTAIPAAADARSAVAECVEATHADLLAATPFGTYQQGSPLTFADNAEIGLDVFLPPKVAGPDGAPADSTPEELTPYVVVASASNLTSMTIEDAAGATTVVNAEYNATVRANVAVFATEYAPFDTIAGIFLSEPAAAITFTLDDARTVRVVTPAGGSLSGSIPHVVVLADATTAPTRSVRAEQAGVCAAASA